MNFWCALLGHKPVKGWCGGPPYAELRRTAVDGIDREHAFLYVECARCGEEFNICNVHLPKGTCDLRREEQKRTI